LNINTASEEQLRAANIGFGELGEAPETMEKAEEKEGEREMKKCICPYSLSAPLLFRAQSRSEATQ
jgi:hypothetical protein